jgi:hypothetical protein
VPAWIEASPVSPASQERGDYVTSTSASLPSPDSFAGRMQPAPRESIIVIIIVMMMMMMMMMMMSGCCMDKDSS